MAATEEVIFSIKVVTQKDKVLFAEVDSDFADTLISFLTLPLGTIVRLLVEHYGDEAPVIGNLNALYKSLENLDPATTFWTEEGRLMLLKPRNPFEAHLQKLRINIDDTEPTTYFICDTCCRVRSKTYAKVSIYHNSMCSCGKSTNRAVFSSENENKIAPGVFTKDTASFLITDDLQLLPNLVGSGLQILKKLGTKETFPVGENTLLVGFDEIMDLLRLSFISRTPLTDLVFHKDVKFVNVPVNPGPYSIIGKKAEKSTSSMKMRVNVVVQKSTGKVILAETMEDFIDLLFGFLSIPLGGVFSLLGNDSSHLTNSSYLTIHNLYKSLTNLKGDIVCGLNIPDMFDQLQLPPKYLSKYQPLPLTEQQIPDPLYYFIHHDGSQYKKRYLTPVVIPRNHSYDKNINVSVMDPKGCEGSYIKGPARFLVTDDLRVESLSTISSFCLLNDLKISAFDVYTEELVIEIGTHEALNILKASVFSNSSLDKMLQRQLNQYCFCCIT